MSAIIATKDRPEMLAETLGSLLACEPPPDQILVADGSPARTAEPVVRALAQSGRVRHLAVDPGLCRQRNRAAAEADGDVLLFVDDDVRLAKDAVGAVRAAFEDPGVAGVSARVLETDPRRFALRGSPLRRLIPGAGRQGTMTACGYPNRLRELDEPHELEFLSGCMMAARADLVRELRFDERLEALGGYALAEDEDFGYRLSRRGRVLHLPQARVEHRNQGFSTARSRDFNRQLAYNRRYLFRKNFPQTPAARLQWWAVFGAHLLHRALNRDVAGIAGLIEGAGRARRE